MARLGLHQDLFYVEANKDWDVTVAPSTPILQAAFADLDRSVAGDASDAERLLRDLLVEEFHASGKRPERMRPLVDKLRAALDAPTLEAGVLPRHRALLRVRLAGKLLALKDRSGAEAECRALLAWMPLEPSVLAWLVDLVWNTHQDPRQHEALHARLEALIPNSTFTWMAEYAAHFRSGRFVDAVDLCERALRSGLDRSFWLMHKGEALDGAGRTEESRAAYREAVEADPNNARALKELPSDDRRVQALCAVVIERATNPAARTLAQAWLKRGAEY
jgi:tetratricopeptide (TPR) repeat protein